MAARYLLLGVVTAGCVTATSVTCSASAPLSCHNTTSYDTCCLNYPGGHLLQTQFWDTNPATGPSDSWTIHGLWPDHCDGTYDSSCDPSRAYTNITQILQAAAPSTLQYMQTYWKDINGNDESFWEHEWGKHGTCISTLNPSCYINYQPTQEAVDFFDRTVSMFQSLPSYSWLSAAGIVPSTTTTYTLSAIQSALTSKFGYAVTINCNSNNELNELWYHYNVQGSVQSGTFEPTSPVGSGSTCPSTGIKYLPKPGGTTVTTATTMTTATASTPVSSASPTTTAPGGALSGKGYLNVITGGAQKGCIISSGTWYTTGTCATFTATPSGSGGFTLTSSKGKCAISSSNALTCSSSVTSPTVFTYDGTYVDYAGSSAFYAASVPSGTTQAAVYTTPNTVSLKLTWQAI
ncbi:d00671a0-e2c6-49b6-9efb-7d3e34966d83 [Thermothielavioides terrestris]|uniref:Ribonuclease T2-like n=1 Tax=Thermothielavioides terrestris TaxID=2587410 RepID=A0A3S4CAE8_9PEZI|nr:d00671a0-e2c6-49b6-9efb-7d3e34966d83 [Thermothielavioides terrestris]